MIWGKNRNASATDVGQRIGRASAACGDAANTMQETRARRVCMVAPLPGRDRFSRLHPQVPRPCGRVHLGLTMFRPSGANPPRASYGQTRRKTAARVAGLADQKQKCELRVGQTAFAVRPEQAQKCEWRVWQSALRAVRPGQAQKRELRVWQTALAVRPEQAYNRG